MRPIARARSWPALLAVPLLACVGCHRIPPVTPELVAAAQGRDPGIDAGTLEHGRTLYVSRCGSCHSPPWPADYADEEWPRWMAKMAKRSKMDAAQQAEALRFVLAVRALPER